MSPKALTGILTGIIFLVVVVYYSLPKSGKQALKAEVNSMNDAQSWRIRTEMQSMGGAVTRTHAAICPDKEHVVEEGRGLASEYIRIGDDIYYRRGATEWKRGIPNSSYFFMNILTARPCLTNPNEPNAKVAGGSEELRQWIEEDIKLARITKGDEKFENDESCREWTVTRVQTVQLRSLKQEYVVCINEKDHLPRTMTATGGFVTHYEWNPSLVIEAPDMSATPTP
jgi:hypothetical protein